MANYDYICSRKTTIVMTILKKINTLSIVLIAATIIGVGLDLGVKWIDYGRGFVDGVREGYAEEKALEDNGKEVTEDDVTYIAADSEEKETKTTFGEFIVALMAITLCIVTVAAFFRLVLNYIGVLGLVRRGDVFSEDLEWRVNHIGIGLIVLYVAEWGVILLLGGDLAESPGCGVLCCGVGMMIVAQIFALGRKMKEDQEFMV